MLSLDASTFNIIALFPVILIAYIALKVSYNIFLHPLRSYPGPILCAASVLPLHKVSLDGYYHTWLHDLHKTYGPVVRHAPNNLSFIEPEVWNEIYGHKSTPLFQKSFEAYGPDIFGGIPEPGLLRANDVSHARQRKLVAHAFSDKALHDQQHLLKHYVELLVRKLKEAIQTDPNSKVDMVNWYNFTTFDIMSDLTFGEPLKLLEESTYSPWVRSVFANVRLLQVGETIRAWPGLEILSKVIAGKTMMAKRKLHMQHAIDRVEKRMALKTDRPDIWTHVLRHNGSAEGKGKGLTQKEMYSNSGLFMVAGTETTATLLSGLTYYLLKNPKKLERLNKEIREAFAKSEDMTMTTLGQLAYMNACISEGLRIYPPVPGKLPRLAPKGGAMLRGKFIPEGTTVAMVQYPAYHSESNFKDPDSFIPERWLPEGAEEYGTDHRGIVQPFSVGPRSCVGKNLAMHEMRLVLASVIWNFDMQLCEESDTWADQKVYILWEKVPLMVRLQPVR
ncbi:benzoate 4-monooxygenase cytochrome P450 [Pleomassaria siparia CBS 279.74]|uniref:Benzoate 4-monooxygenase cytochrome P450 n=1 Tax=Pleomassaria siparia CBS 279.74 TaxID=1314801 RepID=A0A6G1KGP7_9PLEO|nr:benzoate 4-monooxygenase cytochrome P450 [Pleomassaria siparia CBS 279.74]